MATFESACPNCENTFNASEHQIGRIHTCRECGTECIIPSQRIDPGMDFGGFTILYPLGLGASGEVHLAKSQEGTRTALKILFLEDLDDEVDLKRFVRESKFVQSLDHDGLIKVYDAGRDNDFNFIAMEYVEGETLDHMLDKHGELAEKDAVKVIRDVSSVMKYVWDSNRLVHRDLKPANIMVGYDGTTKVMDLGIAKSYLYELTQLTDPETIIGSPPYMSPEQCAPGKPIDFRADVYSLGCTLFQLVTNEYAFFGDTPMATVRMQIFDKPSDPRDFVPGLSEKMVVVMHKMMSKQAAKRHRSWDELLADLDELL